MWESCALIDSGASHLFVTDKRLFDEKYHILDELKSVRTANADSSSDLPVVMTGVLLAIFKGDDGDEVVIRCRAHLVDGLTENLIPASLLASCVGCWLRIDGDDERPGRTKQTVRLVGRDSTSATVVSRELEGVYMANLTPLSDQAKAWYRDFFNSEPPEHGQIESVVYQGNIKGKAYTTRTDPEMTDDMHPPDTPDPPSPPKTREELELEAAADRRRKRMDEAVLIHRMFGHASPQRLFNSVKSGAVRLPAGIRMPKDFVELCRLSQCTHCQRANPTREPRVWRRLANDIKPFQTMHVDLKPVPRLTAGAPLTAGILDPYLPRCPHAHVLVAVCEVTRLTIMVPTNSKKKDDIAQAVFELDTQVRKLMVKALEHDSEAAHRLGYSWDKIRDTTTCIIPHFHADCGQEFEESMKNLPDNQVIGSDVTILDDVRDWVPHLIAHGRFRRGGAPRVTTSSPVRKYWNGVVERKIQACHRRAVAMLLSAGAGAKIYVYALMYAAYLENLEETTVPDRNSPNHCTRGVPFQLALGFAFDAAKRPLHVLGALAAPLLGNHESTPKGHVKRILGVCLMPAPFPSRNWYIAVSTPAGPNIRLVGPEMKASDGGCVFRPVEERIDALHNHYQSRIDSTAFPEPEEWQTMLETDPDGSVEQIIKEVVNTTHSGGGNVERQQADEGQDDAPAPTPVEENWMGAGPYEEIDDENEADDHLTPPDDPGLQPAETRDVEPSSKSEGDAAEPEGEDAGGEDSSYVTVPEFSESILAGVGEEPDEGEALPALANMVAHGLSVKAFRAMAHRGEGLDAPVNAHAKAIRPSTGEMRKSLDEFSASEKQVAYDKEMKSLDTKGVLRRVEPSQLPRGVKILGLKLILAVKRDNSLKARLVGQGFGQRQFRDFFQTYSPVASLQSILLIVTIAATFGMDLWTADAESAYLQADLEEELYVKMPNELGGGIYRLLKALYGTKQAGMVWYRKLKKALEDCGLEESPCDPCLFIMKDADSNTVMLVAVVVDDLLGVARKEVWTQFVEELTKRDIKLDVGSVGPATEFNGIRIQRMSKHHYILDQQVYIEELERAFTEKSGRKIPSKKLTVPLGALDDQGLMEPGIIEDGSRSSAADRVMAENPEARKKTTETYLFLLGCLMWVAHTTRPDIAYAVGAAGQRSKEPMTRHLESLVRVLSYIVQTKERTLVFDCRNQVWRDRCAVVGFSDSDHASDKETRRSRTGGWIAVNGCPVKWISKRQTMVSTSSTAAETVASSLVALEMRKLRENLNAIGFGVKWLPLFGDNVQVLSRMVCDKPRDTLGAKQISVLTKQLQEAASNNFEDVWPFYANTHRNVADLLTKGSLKGKDAATKWGALAELVRGAKPNGEDWVEALMRAERNSGGQRVSGAQRTALERAQPMVNLETYFEKSRWRERFSFGKGTKIMWVSSNGEKRAGAIPSHDDDDIPRIPEVPRVLADAVAKTQDHQEGARRCPTCASTVTSTRRRREDQTWSGDIEGRPPSGGRGQGCLCGTHRRPMPKAGGEAQRPESGGTGWIHPGGGSRVPDARKEVEVDDGVAPQASLPRAKLASWQLRSAKNAPKLKGEMGILELFSGENKSLTNALLEKHEDPTQVRAYSLDFKPNLNPTFVTDIREWRPLDHFTPGDLKAVWASPDCIEYSPAKTVGVRNLKDADRVLFSTIRAIFLLRPEVFGIENPVGEMRERAILRPLERFRKRTSQCQFSDEDGNDLFPYRKDTDVYTNVPCTLPTCQDTPCAYKKKYGRHEETAQRGSSRNGTPGNPTEVLHRVPKALCQHILLEAFGEGSPGPVPYHPDDIPESTPGYEDLRLYTDESISIDEAIAILEAKYGSEAQATRGGRKRGHKRKKHRRR